MNDTLRAALALTIMGDDTPVTQELADHDLDFGDLAIISRALADAWDDTMPFADNVAGMVLNGLMLGIQYQRLRGLMPADAQKSK